MGEAFGVWQDWKGMMKKKEFSDWYAEQEIERRNWWVQKWNTYRKTHFDVNSYMYIYENFVSNCIENNHFLEYKMFFTGSPVSWIMMAPSITPYRAGGPNNPGLRLYQFEKKSGQVKYIYYFYFSYISTLENM